MHALVPPDAIRVWRGFRSPSLTREAFYEKLGSVFIPAGVKMQIDVGLTAYCPTVLDGLPNKPASLPDETAILSWRSQATYRHGFTTLAARTYTLTHAALYAPDSRADFALPFTGVLAQDQPVYLVDAPADWMRGEVRHLVASRRPGDAPDAFRAAIARALTEIRGRLRLDGAIACAGADAVVYWELTRPGEPSGVAFLDAVVGWKGAFVSTPTDLAVGLWDSWPGMHVKIGNSFNMQFERGAPPHVASS